MVILTPLFTYSLIHLLIYSSIHSLTHLLNHSEQVEVIAEYLNWYQFDELNIFSNAPSNVTFATDCTYSGELHLHLINVFEIGSATKFYLIVHGAHRRKMQRCFC